MSPPLKRKEEVDSKRVHNNMGIEKAIQLLSLLKSLSLLALYLSHTLSIANSITAVCGFLDEEDFFRRGSAMDSTIWGIFSYNFCLALKPFLVK
ncbi:hypothetical protein HN51_050212 [Arachis hypogaea]